MPNPLDYTWGEEQSQYALMCAVTGDCVFDVVNKYAGELEKQMRSLSRKTPGVLKSVTRGSWLGLVPAKVRSSWLAALLSREQKWPDELSRDEKALLRMAVKSYQLTGKRLPASVDYPANRADSVKALKKFAEAYENQVAVPLWRAYEAAADKAAEEIAPLCKAQFGEDCSQAEAKNIFKGDLQRGTKVDSLDMAETAQELLRDFLFWIKS